MKSPLSLSKLGLFLVAVTAALTLSNCDLGGPEPIGRINPLDSLNPDTHGDPYKLTAELADGGVRLAWQPVDFPGLTGYSIYRKTDDSVFHHLIQYEDIPTTYTDRAIQNGHRYEYYVVVATRNGEGDPSAVAKAAVNSEPVLIIEGENVAETPTRSVMLTILAFGATKILLSNTADFEGAVWEPYVTRKPWMLTTGAGMKRVFMRVIYASGDTTGAVEDEIEPAELRPTITIAGGAATTPTRRVIIEIVALGATYYKISNGSFQETPPVLWLPMRDSLSWMLEEGQGTKIVHVKVRNDFLIEGEASDQIEPATLNPSLQILPDSIYINHTDVTLSMPNVGATEMKISNSSDFASASWQQYQEQISWNLEVGDGWKRVYAWFRNDWNSTTVPVIDSLGLDTHSEIASFTWTTTGGDTLVPGDVVTFTIQAANDAFGVETCGTASVTVEGWHPMGLTGLADGSYSETYTLGDSTPRVSNARVTASFRDRVGNLAASTNADRRLTASWIAAGDEQIFPLGATGDSIIMCWIPPGEFQMGSPESEQFRGLDEGPAHLVTFVGGFWMGKYEVTQRQWQAVMGSNPAAGFGEGSDYPVYSVSWNDIQEFEQQLSGQYRLPSEAEWEYACRSGSTTRFYWGEDAVYDQIGIHEWFGDNSNRSSHPVGMKTPNAWRLYDISGNVREWCEDWYHDNYNDAPNDGSAWVEPSGSSRTSRCGSWGDTPQGSRTSRRNSIYPSYRDATVGFRLARDTN